MSQSVVDVELGPYAKQSYLRYAMSVVLARALPLAWDGLKPVQRRILFAMEKLDLQHKPATKCARVIGDVLGKYHPHGDSSVYDAMVRMAQPFRMRYPLIEGQGNFGSRDGDHAAAMRYTEARLAPIAEALLSELKWDTVPFAPNYDGKEQEPQVLPVRLPFMMLNGSSGIAVGLATDFFSHNLHEVVEGVKLLLNKPHATIDELMEKIPGPDFPTGCQIITPPDVLRKIYTEGRGSVRLRSRWNVEQDGKDWKLVFYELPHTTSVEAVALEIEELLNPKPNEKNNKKLTSEQLAQKQFFGGLIESVENHSDHNLRLVITPRQRRSDPTQLALALCASTSLEMNVPGNFVAIDQDGKPHKDTPLTWLKEWCAFRRETVRRRTADQKARIDDRLHIIAGRLIVFDHLQEVVRLIQESEQPLEDLMRIYGLSERQANNVLDMQLRQLARLESASLIEERERLLPESQRLGEILLNDTVLKRLIIKELDADAKRYGDARRSLLEEAAPAAGRDLVQNLTTEKASNESIAVALSERGWLGWCVSKNAATDDNDFKLKAGDSPRRVFNGRRSDHLLLLDEQGRGYSLPLTQLSGKNDSAPLTTWLEPGTKIIEGAIGTPEDRFLVSASNGFGFVLEGRDWIGRVKAGKDLIRQLAAHERPLPPRALGKAQAPLEQDPRTVAALAADGRLVTFPLAEMKAMPKGKGVGLMGGIDAATPLLDIALLADDASILVRHPQGTLRLTQEDLAKVHGPRAAGRKGKILRPKQNLLGFDVDAPASPTDAEPPSP